MNKVQVGIVGGTGYTGVELLRILAQHPHVNLKAITSRQEAGMPVSRLFPSLRGAVDLAFSSPDEAMLSSCDVVFFATPNGVAMKQVPSLLEAGVKVIDLAADFRLKDAAEWERWYGMPHACPELLSEAVYGLPEINREAVRGARLVANPGCYPTAVQLGFLPLLEAGLIDPSHLIADAKSGVSGAGRKAETHILFAEASDSFKAYGAPGHRHLPEIRQGLSTIAAKNIGLTFVPHLLPLIRGIHATLYGVLMKGQGGQKENDLIELQALYEKRYQHERFVDVLPLGSHPETRSVRASNICRIAVHRPQGGDTVVVLSVIDNLVKGAAGQAVQNFNLMCGFDESLGLLTLPVMP
ncbi:MAG: N-acetyl-gamma-glutamyl-phosphate reductase [Pseudomonadota bacterium]